jgi:thioredoxin-like negative regulator of GroEL
MKILKFYAPWCGPCKQQGEFLSKVTGVEVQDVNIEEDDILQEVHRVRSVPMMVLLDDDGETLREFRTLTKTEDIQEVVDFYTK